ncbi:endonuclease [Candidatus Woesearchaeota archaeon]|nr:endonuclease [Candidatus Woesearchaeota archaeon]
MNKIRHIYKLLLDRYGPQKWWPTTLKKDIHPTYHGQKLNNKARFEIAVGAILTQNTSWKNVEKAIIELNRKNLLSAEKIKKANQKILAKTIKSAGYYNQKAERLKILADFFSKNKFEDLMKKDAAELREIFLKIKGVGPETCDSIILYALEKPIFVVDAYTKRMCGHLKLCKKDASYREIQDLFMKNLKQDTKMFSEYHALIVEHAKHCYSRNPYSDRLLKQSL